MSEDWRSNLEKGGARLGSLSENKAQRLLNKSSLEDLSYSSTGSRGDIESVEYLGSRIESIARFVPFVDFSKPENFAKFGLAAQYYEDSIKRI